MFDCYVIDVFGIFGFELMCCVVVVGLVSLCCYWL